MSAGARLVFVLPSLAPAGAERVTLNLLEELGKQGRSCTLFVLRDRPQASAPRGVDTRVLGARGRVAAIRKLAKAFGELGPHDIVVPVMDETACMTVIARILARSPARIVPVAHSSPSAFLKAMGLMRSLVWLVALNLSAFGFTKWLMVSRCVERDYLKHVPTIGNRTRVSYSAALRGIAYQPKLKRPFPESDCLQVILVGRLIVAKGFDIAIDAASLLQRAGQRVRLSLLGDGPLRSQLESQACQRLAPGSFEFLGFRAEPYPVMAAADLYWHPSRWDGLPTSLIEAMALSLPCIAFACQCGPEEILAPAGSGVLLRGGDRTAAGLAEATLGLLKDPERVEAMRPQAVAAASRFTADKAVRDFLAVIHG